MSRLSRLRNFPERMRARHFPRLANALLNLATRAAGKQLSETEPLAILVDNSVLGLAVTHETRWLNFDGFGAAVRVPVYGIRNQSYEHTQASYLTGLVHLAKAGKVKPWVSAELLDEQFRQPVGRYRGYGLFDHSLFSEVRLDSIDGSVFPSIGPRWLGLPSAATQQRRRIAASGNLLFSELYALLQEQQGKKCDQDAWHITTAEERGMFCFLTVDRKLLLATKNLAHKQPLSRLRTKIMSPQDLSEHLGIYPIPPILLSYGGKDAMVRTDHTMPHERRRKRSEYRKP